MSRTQVSEITFGLIVFFGWFLTLAVGTALGFVIGRYTSLDLFGEND